jgi:hypothetical protein
MMHFEASTILKKSLLGILFLLLVAIVVAVFANRRNRSCKKKRVNKKQPADVFVYLQHFDVNDVKLRKSPQGGWNATYLSKLAYGINRLCKVDHFRTDPTMRTEGSSWSGSEDENDRYDGYAGTTWQDTIYAYGRGCVSDYVRESPSPEALHVIYRNNESGYGFIDEDSTETVTFSPSDHHDTNADSLFSIAPPSKLFGSRIDHVDDDSRNGPGYPQAGHRGAEEKKNYAELRPNQGRAIV